MIFPMNTSKFRCGCPSSIWAGQPLSQEDNDAPDIKAEEGAGRENHLHINYKAIWILQTPMMLMSYSWVTFLVGYELLLAEQPTTVGSGTDSKKPDDSQRETGIHLITIQQAVLRDFQVVIPGASRTR
jgi:hypothetical protein